MANLYILNMFKSKLRRLLLEETIEKKLRKKNANNLLAIYQLMYNIFQIIDRRFYINLLQ